MIDWNLMIPLLGESEWHTCCSKCGAVSIGLDCSECSEVDNRVMWAPKGYLLIGDEQELEKLTEILT